MENFLNILLTLTIVAMVFMLDNLYSRAKKTEDRLSR
jgi:hypothetical protein